MESSNGNSMMIHDPSEQEVFDTIKEIQRDIRGIHAALAGSVEKPGLAERVRRLETLAGWFVAGFGACLVGFATWVWQLLTTGHAPHN